MGTHSTSNTKCPEKHCFSGALCVVLIASHPINQAVSQSECEGKLTENSAATEAILGLRQLRVAVVHDWLTAYAGSEKVLEQILLLFPQAELFTLVDHLPTAERTFVDNRTIHTSLLQKIPFSAQVFRKLLWLFPLAIESFDLSLFDLILSSSHAVAKGVLSGPDQLHICYCHTPIRYAWDCQHEYLRQGGLDAGIRSIYARVVLHYLRIWDMRTASGVDHFIANSSFVARRIGKVYSRKSTVIHPPADIDKFPMTCVKGDYYVTASRLVAYKRVDLIVQAFADLPDRRLIVIGDGPEMRKCRKLAAGNVQLLGHQSDKALCKIVAGARAFVFAAEEDFGISVVEAQACGTPVICYGKGGVLDSVVDHETGIYFSEQTPESIRCAIRRFEGLTTPLSADRMRAQALRFSPEEFRKHFVRLVAARWEEHSAHIRGTPSETPESLAMGA
jgi:glycosyltransferase involved in cell wall biosynthesis